MPSNSAADISLYVTTKANKKPADGGFEILIVAGAGFKPTIVGL